MSGRARYQMGSGNVFADLGLPNADELLAKADLAFQISSIIEARGLTQTRAAEILGVDQPKVSALRRGQLSGFSMERLYRFLKALGNDIEIRVKPLSGSREPRVRVLTGKPAASAKPR